MAVTSSLDNVDSRLVSFTKTLNGLCLLSTFLSHDDLGHDKQNSTRPVRPEPVLVQRPRLEVPRINMVVRWI